MKKIEGYIQKELAASFAFILSILTITLWIVQSFKFITVFLRSSAGIFSFLKLTFLSLPDLLTIITPISAFISIIVVYNRFQLDREITVLYAAGYSSWDILKPAAQFAAYLTVGIYLISLTILPASFRQMRDMETELKTAFPAVLAQEGVFTSFGDVTLYVNKKFGNRLEGILAYIHKDDENPYSIAAKQGEMVIQDGMPKILMADGTRQEKDLKTNEISMLYFDKTIISLVEEGQKANQRRTKKKYEKDILELLSFKNFMTSAGQVLIAEGFQRLLTPLYSIAFACIALYFMILSPFKRGGNFIPISKAVFFTVLLQGVCISLMNLGSRHALAVLGAYLLIGATIFGIFYHAKRA